jgi:asparagine synthase (glutamine-hydrolysing)
MSGILAVVDHRQRFNSDDSVTRMLVAMAGRGTLSEIWRSDDSVLAVARFDWEMADGFSGRALVVHDGGISVAADATLYYRDDLLRRLSAVGVRPNGATAGHLIAAAYRAWEDDCTEHLEGDYAFVVRDHTKHRTFAARDFMGRRPLYYAEIDGALVIASTVSAIIAHPDCPNEYDRVALAEIVGVSMAGHGRTPYAAVSALTAATSLSVDRRGSVRTRTYWQARLDEAENGESFDDAAERLREILGAAIVERCAPSGATALWLSGGYDSPAMFGIGNAALERTGRPYLQAISYSYPVGDAAREDELIEEVAAHWRARPRWLSIDDAPLLRDAAANAARADVPFQHAFENWLRLLFSATRDGGARVALNGDGGDQLFAVSTIFLRDLFSDFRWAELRREWRATGGAGARELWRSVVRPEVAQRVRERRGRRQELFGMPDWLDRRLVRAHDIDGNHANVEASFAAGGGRAGAETRRSVSNPATPRIAAALNALALEHGVELRVPLFDRRLVEFAFSRPRTERASLGAVKHLLRKSAEGLVPARVLEPRKSRTGGLTSYFAKSFRADADGIVTASFERSRLATLGIVDDAALQQAWRDYKVRGVGGGGHLVVAFQTELWLRAREKSPGVMTDLRPALFRMPAAGFVQ